MRADADTPVLVFAKAPIPGIAKSRLIPALGEQGAALLHERLTLCTLDMVVAAGVGPIELWCAPSAEHSFFEQCSNCYPLSLHTQPGGDLGIRLRFAHDRVLASHRRAMFLGTDCPALDRSVLMSVARELDKFDAVIVPAEDGGYVLLGLARRCSEVFEGIDWSTERVLSQTLARLAEAKMRFVVHAPLWDVDRPADYLRLVSIYPQLAV